MTEAAARARVAAWLAPISGDNPAGEDARYDPLHEEIRNEAAKIDSPSSGTTDWAKLLPDAEKLTCNQAKDLLIESYGAYALFQEEGLLGLAAGLFLLAESMDQYWDTMYPPARRIRARVNAISWLTAKLEATLPEVPIGAGDHDAVEALDAAAKRLRAVVGERFTDTAPALRPLADTIERIKMSLPVREAAAEAPTAAEAPDTEPPPPPDGAPAPAPTEAAPALAEAAPAPAEAAPAPAEAAPPAEATPDDLYAALVEAASKWTQPCPGDAPAGIDAKYELVHEELRGDVAAADSPSGGDLKWPSVIGRAGGILESTSKDLLIACYLTFALWDRDRIEGLALGLAMLEQICDKYWDDSFPPVRRVRGRANALSWLLARLETPLPDETLTPESKVPVAKLVVATKRFSATVRDKFGDAAPSLRPFEDAVKRLEMSVPAPAAKPAPKPAAAKAAPAAAPKRAAPKAASVPVSLAGGDAELTEADPKATRKFTRQVATSLYKAARAIRQATMKDPNAYVFLRTALFLLLDPPEVSGGKTQLEAPAQLLGAQLEELLSTKDWEGLLKKAESALYASPFWFDVHRYSAVALANLGPDYEAAHAAAIAGSAALALHLKPCLDASFGDGTPICSQITKEWIASDVIPSGGGGGGGGGEGAELLGEARTLAGGGDKDGAMKLLQGLAHSARSGRARFMARFSMAQTLATGPTVAVAEGILASLLPEIDATGLERWEPELAADCYRAHLGCLQQLESDPLSAERKAMVFQRLCRVDPLAAAKAAG